MRLAQAKIGEVVFVTSLDEEISPSSVGHIVGLGFWKDEFRVEIKLANETFTRRVPLEEVELLESQEET